MIRPVSNREWGRGRLLDKGHLLARYWVSIDAVAACRVWLSTGYLADPSNVAFRLECHSADR